MWVNFKFGLKKKKLFLIKSQKLELVFTKKKLRETLAHFREESVNFFVKMEIEGVHIGQDVPKYSKCHRGQSEHALTWAKTVQTAGKPKVHEKL